MSKKKVNLEDVLDALDGDFEYETMHFLGETYTTKKVIHSRKSNRRTR